MSSFCTEHGTNYVRTCDACGVAAVERIADLERELAEARKLAQAYYARGELDMGSQAWNLAKAVGWKPVREILDEQGGDR